LARAGLRLSLRARAERRETRVSYPLRAIAGIGPAMVAKLRSLGIRTTEKLLEASKTAKARKNLAEKLGVDEQTVLRWANLTDRMRIKGVREPYAELLKDAGVDTVKELKYRNPGRLAEAMAEANAKRRRVNLLPTAKRVEHWIADARKLQPKITY
jgi:predicted flap endonuclease-1-like 5' DNA nuclease